MSIASFEYIDGDLKRVDFQRNDDCKNVVPRGNVKAKYNKVLNVALTGNIAVMAFASDIQPNEWLSITKDTNAIYHNLELKQVQVSNPFAERDNRIKYFPEEIVNSRVVTQHFDYGISYQEIHKLLLDGSLKTLANEGFSGQTKNENINQSSDIIVNVTTKEGENVMYQKLIDHRERVEKYGMFSGLAFGVASLIPPLLSSIEWGATLPAAFLFLSLPAFILLRKQLRRMSDEY